MGAGVLFLISTSAMGAELDFYRDVYPLLKANCISCHNKTTTKGGAEHGVAGADEKGRRHRARTHPRQRARKASSCRAAAHLDEDLLMPPKNNKSGAVDLTTSEVELLKTWIDQGAKQSVQQARQVAWQPLPPGVNPIYTVAMTKDGRFAACGRANQIFLYDLATRQFITRLADSSGVAHRSLVQSLAFSPDGTRLASGSFREVKIWRLENGKPAPATTDAAPSRQADEALLKKVADTAQGGDFEPRALTRRQTARYRLRRRLGARVGRGDGEADHRVARQRGGEPTDRGAGVDGRGAGTGAVISQVRGDPHRGAEQGARRTAQEGERHHRGDEEGAAGKGEGREAGAGSEGRCAEGAGRRGRPHRKGARWQTGCRACEAAEGRARQARHCHEGGEVGGRRVLRRSKATSRTRRPT